MKDPRIEKLAHNLITYSVGLKPGEKILIETIGYELPLTTSLIKKAYEVGGVPYSKLKDQEIQRTLLQNCKEEQISEMAEMDIPLMEKVDAYIAIRNYSNISEYSSVPAEKMKIFNEIYKKRVHNDIRLKKKWCVLRYPSPSMAQLAKMSTEQFEDFYFNVCNLDYSKMSEAMNNLVEVMNKTDKVKIVSPATELTFRIGGMPKIKCDGKMNIPDGEVYTAPIKDSVNGTITYNTPSNYSGSYHDKISFVFENGKIVKATSTNTNALNYILDTDEGARYVGEFAIGVNPLINTPILDTLFDEKISGSIHFTPGNSYDDCFNGNSSAVHWDLVLIQRPEYGGGEIWFDDVLVRKDGLFILDELKCLNPENLL